MVEVFSLILDKREVDGFVFKFGSASEDIEVFYLIVVWEPLKDVIFGNFVFYLSVDPTSALFKDDLILK
jgi:hypothetical protein